MIAPKPKIDGEYYSPQFTHIATATADQTQAREAAANAEMRKKLIQKQEQEPPPQPMHISLPPQKSPKPETYWNPPSPEPVVSPPPPLANLQKRLPGFNLPKPETFFYTPRPEQIIIPPFPPPLQQQTDNNLPSPQQSPQQRAIIAKAATSQSSQSSQPSNPLSAIGSFFSSIAKNAANAASAITSGITNAAQNAGSAISGALSNVGSALSNAKSAITNALSDVDLGIQAGYALAYGTAPQFSSNPFQQFLDDFAKGSALLGYTIADVLGGAGWELADIVKGKGPEDFWQAVSEFNKARIGNISGQDIARGAGNVMEVALPVIITGIAQPELVPAVIAGEVGSVGIGEAVSKVTTGRWQSLPEVLHEANAGGVLASIGGATGSALGGALGKLGTMVGGKVGDFLAGTGGKALAGAAVNVALTAPFTNNPEQLTLAGALGALGGAAGGLVSKVPWLEQSEAVKNAIDVSERGAKLGNKLVNEGITKGVLTPDEISGKTTTQIGDLLREKYITISNKIIKSLDKNTVENLKEKGIITDTQVLKPDEFIKSVKDKVPEDQLQLLKDTAKLVEKYNEGIKELVGGWKLRLGDRTLLYRLKLGDEREIGIGSAGKSRIFNDIRTIQNIEANVAGIYNNPSDVRDTITALMRQGASNEAEFLESLYNVAKAVKSPLSKLEPNENIELSLRDLEKDLGKAKTEMLAQTIKDYFKNEIGKRNVVIYGSNSVKQYLEDIARKLGATLDTVNDPDYYLIKRGNQVLWKWRRPGDVDAFINTSNPNDLDKIAQDLADRMNKVIGTNRFKAEGHLVVDTKTGEHVVDLHMPNEPSDMFNIYANDSTGADLGIQRPTPNYADLGVAKVSQIALDKGNAIGALRETSLNELLKEINARTQIDNPDYIIYIAKQILGDKNPETIKDVLHEFWSQISGLRLRNYFLKRFSQEFNIPESDIIYRPLTRIGSQIRSDIEQILNERYRYLAPASYRFKDAQDFLALLKLAAELKNDNNLRALYEQLRYEFEERGIIPKGWMPNQINWNVVQNAQKLINSMSSAGGAKSVTFASPIISIGGSINAPSSKFSTTSVPNRSTSTTSTGGSGGGGGAGGGRDNSKVSGTSTTTGTSTSTSDTSTTTKYNNNTSNNNNNNNNSNNNGNGSSSGGSSSDTSYTYIIYTSDTSTSTSDTSTPEYPYVYILLDSSSLPPVFYPSSVFPSESFLPMGPPPIVPSAMPGGFGGGGGYNVQEISGVAGEVIRL